MVAQRTQGAGVRPTTDHVQPPSYSWSESFIFDDSLTLEWPMKDGWMPSPSCLPSHQPLILCRLSADEWQARQREVTLHWSGQLSMIDDFPAVWSAGWIIRVR